MGPTWPFLLMYESHNMRHTGFHRLTVVNETLGVPGVTLIYFDSLRIYMSGYVCSYIGNNA